MKNIVNVFSKVLLMTLVATASFGYFPAVTKAQYYNYNYNYYPTLDVTTNSATNVEPFSAVLNGSVETDNNQNPYGYGTTVWFEYGTNSNLNFSSPQQNLTVYGFRNFSAAISNLTPDTKYYFRAVSQNNRGIDYGSTKTFRTDDYNYRNDYRNNGGFIVPAYYTNPPVVYQALTAITRPAESIASRSVELNSLILSPENDATNTWFEWGTTSYLGNRTPLVSVSLPSVKHVSTITQLNPGTTYYFRAVAEDGISRNVGATLSFTTKNATSVSTPTVTPKDTVEPAPAPSNLSTNALSAGFLPNTIFGWILLAILILVLIILCKRVMAPERTTVVHTNGHDH